MISFTSKYINTVGLIISIIIFIFLNNIFFSIPKIDSEISNYNQIENPQDQIENITKENSIENTANQSNNKKKNKKIKWKIEIHKVNITAEIEEGTSKEIMDSYVGHFEESSKDKGNVCLAAHNRGYKVNYFQDLKKMKEGDEIIYTYNGKQRKYIVKTHKIIKDTDWELLEETKENKITLITCVENQPEYRRCIQGEEV